MTIRESVLKLLTTVPEPGRTVNDWAEGLLRLAAESGVLALRVVRGDGATLVRQIHVIADDEASQTEDSSAFRVFRPLLACLATKAKEELGIPFDPYGGRFAFTRPRERGLVRIDIEFTNTSQAQEIVLKTMKLPATRKTAVKKKVTRGK